MKRLLIIVAALILVTQWYRVSDWINPPEDFSDLKGTQVTLYSTSWCTYCAKTRDFLNRHHIAYRDFDIEKSRQARQQFDALGGIGVPLVVVNQQVIRGYNPPLILQYLDKQPETHKDMS